MLFQLKVRRGQASRLQVRIILFRMRASAHYFVAFGKTATCRGRCLRHPCLFLVTLFQVKGAYGTSPWFCSIMKR